MTVKRSERKAAEAYLELLRAIHISVMEMGIPMAHQRSVGNTVTSDPGEWAEGLDTDLPKTSEIGTVPFEHPVESDLFIKQADVLANQWGLSSYNSIVDNLKTLGVSTRELMYAWDIQPQVIPATRGGSSSGRAGFNPNVGLQNETVYPKQFYTQNPFSEKPGIFEAGYTHGVYRPSNVLTGRQGTFVGPNTEEVLASGGDPRRPGVKLRPDDEWMNATEDERKWMQAEQNTLLNRFTSSNQEFKIDPHPAKIPHQGKFDHLIPLIPNSALEWGLELGIGIALGPAGRAAMGNAASKFVKWLNPDNYVTPKTLEAVSGLVSRRTRGGFVPQDKDASIMAFPDQMGKLEKPDPSDFASVREYEIAVQEYWQRVNPDPGVEKFTEMTPVSGGGDNIIPLNRAANREEWEEQFHALWQSILDHDAYILGKRSTPGSMGPREWRDVLDELAGSELLDDALYKQYEEIIGQIDEAIRNADHWIIDDPWTDPELLAEASTLFKQEHKAGAVKGGMNYNPTNQELADGGYMKLAIENQQKRLASSDVTIAELEMMLDKDSPSSGLAYLSAYLDDPYVVELELRKHLHSWLRNKRIEADDHPIFRKDGSRRTSEERRQKIQELEEQIRIERIKNTPENPDFRPDGTERTPEERDRIRRKNAAKKLEIEVNPLLEWNDELEQQIIKFAENLGLEVDDAMIVYERLVAGEMPTTPFEQVKAATDTDMLEKILRQGFDEDWINANVPIHNPLSGEPDLQALLNFDPLARFLELVESGVTRNTLDQADVFHTYFQGLVDDIGEIAMNQGVSIDEILDDPRFWDLEEVQILVGEGDELIEGFGDNVGEYFRKLTNTFVVDPEQSLAGMFDDEIWDEILGWNIIDEDGWSPSQVADVDLAPLEAPLDPEVQKEAMAKFLQERKYHLDDSPTKTTDSGPFNTGSGSGPGKGELFDQDADYIDDTVRKFYGWMLASAGGGALLGWLDSNPQHVSKLIDLASSLGSMIGLGSKGTGHQSIDSLNPGIANQVFGMNSALAGSTIIAGAEDPSIFDGMTGELRRVGQNPEKVLPKDVQIDLQNGDAVFVGYESMKDQEEAISLAPRFGVEVSADLPHIWRKPNRKTIIPPADQGWDSDRLKKFAMQQQFYPDAGLRRRT